MEPFCSNSDIHLSSTVGRVNVEESLVADAVSGLIQDLSRYYFLLIEDAREEYNSKSGTHFSRHLPDYLVPCFFIIPSRAVEIGIEKPDPRFSAHLFYNLGGLDPKHPLGKMILQVVQVASQSGLLFKEVEVWLEKGVMCSDTAFWHLDSPWYCSHEISVCYSSKNSWNTRILDVPNTLRIFNVSDISQVKTPVRAENMIRKIEKFALPALHGHLYQMNNVLHRAPMPTDLGDGNLSGDDYRLLMRFSTASTS